MGCICDKEVLFFGGGNRDTSHLLYLFLTVYRHDLIGLKNQRFCPVENDRKGKNGLKQYSVPSVGPLIVFNFFFGSSLDIQILYFKTPSVNIVTCDVDFTESLALLE
jgi:hypothetical protein